MKKSRLKRSTKPMKRSGFKKTAYLPPQSMIQIQDPNIDELDIHLFTAISCKIAKEGKYEIYNDKGKIKVRPLKKRKPLRKVSKKRSSELRLYKKLRAEYLEAHPICEVSRCTKPSTDIHHKKKRHRARLNDTNFFMGTCRYHHTKIHNNPAWAYERNYLIKEGEDV